MLRNGGFFLMRISDNRMLLFLLLGVVSLLGRCEYRDEVVLAGVAGRSSVVADVVVRSLDAEDDSVLDRVLLVANELLEAGRFLVAARSTIDGFPANTTDTTRAVSSWLLLRVGEVGSSTLES